MHQVRALSGSILLCSLAFGAARLMACNVPVYRYALENWEPDDYQVVVWHDGTLTDDQRETLVQLRSMADDTQTPTNLSARSVDVGKPLAEHDQQLLDQYGSPNELPELFVVYPPFTDTQQLAYRCPFDDEGVRSLVDSPSRREVSRRIVNGDTAVWVLIEQEDAEKTERAVEVLSEQLKHLAEALEPARGEIAESSEPISDESGSSTPDDGSIRFSILRLDRNDPDERAFVSMLLHSESGLEDFSEPIAIPIYGRGRTHYALVGRGINENNIQAACHFLVGACSCEVKVQNPGTDLLIRANWDSPQLSPDGHGETSLPELTGLGDLQDNLTALGGTDAQVTNPSGSEAAEPATEIRDENRPVPSITGAQPQDEMDAAQSSDSPTEVTSFNSVYWAPLGVVGLGIVVVALGTFYFKGRL